ncbi:pyrroline-5-carboxylate reductase [Bacillus sp. FJAT-49736]|uniref:pyrroline-5-carboxylate reductase n=1 Tax=Bacillus sp. FJAT-49736 TaxID=2833582 RepID=UPI001BC9028E|nr:pyrroline-5-carboxylate reductase [Bacillus sp. FJAT-49736]MBS4172965.1 pyrroline-5-carboxylate reductase [Bacillus sp. FJAT-49736]
MTLTQKIAFLGAGPMAEAIISGLINTEIIPAHHIYVQNQHNKSRLMELNKKYHIHIDPVDIGNMDIIVLAMQPKHIKEALDSIKSKLSEKQIVISVVTSVTTMFMENYLNKKTQLIRVMPNTSSMVGESATALSSGKYTSKESIALATEIFRGIGEVYQIEEKHMDLFTGIAGSAPAYFYALMEEMEKFSIQSGLPKTMVRSIIAQTVLGSAKMALAQEESFTELIQNVAAPNGPTAKGLQALQIYGGNKAIVEAVKATTERSKEMGSPFAEDSMLKLK